MIDLLQRFVHWWRHGEAVDSDPGPYEAEAPHSMWGHDTEPSSPGALDDLVFGADMKLTLNRRPSFGGATIGELMFDGELVCYTLEDEIREVPGEPVANWKIRGRTAIPAGSYRITLEHSPRFGPNTLTVNGVVGFTGVRIHAGNSAEDTEGCPLVGMRVTETGIVGGTSGPALRKLKWMVEDAVKRGGNVWLDINNPTAVA